MSNKIGLLVLASKKSIGIYFFSNIANQNINGSIPSSLGNLYSSLTWLSLSGNQLTGTNWLRRSKMNGSEWRVQKYSKQYHVMSWKRVPKYSPPLWHAKRKPVESIEHEWMYAALRSLTKSITVQTPHLCQQWMTSQSK